MDVDIHRSRHLLDVVRNLYGNIVVLLRSADDLYVNRSGKAVVEDLVNDVGRLEEERQLRELVTEDLPKLGHISARRSVILFELHQNFAISRADGGTVAIGQVDAAGRQADVVQRHVQFLGWNCVAYRFFNLFKDLGRLFKSCASRGTDVKSELTGINRREEILSDKRDQQEG